MSSTPIDRFVKILKLPYGPKEVAADIANLLKTHAFKPVYLSAFRTLLANEIENCQKALNDGHFRLFPSYRETMAEDPLQYSEEDIKPILDFIYPPETYPEGSQPKAFWHDYFVHPRYGRQKAPPLCWLMNSNETDTGNRRKYAFMVPIGPIDDPFYSIFTAIHELMHGVQSKYGTSSKELDKYNRKKLFLLEQGLSIDQANAELKQMGLDKGKDHSRAFMEIQANAAAATYMMLMARKTGDKDLMTQVEKRVLNISASMSGSFRTVGLAYFDYPATKAIIADIKAGKCDHLINDTGLLDWKALYDYTDTKIKAVGYTDEVLSTLPKVADRLNNILEDVEKTTGQKWPKCKGAFLKQIEKQAKNLKHPMDKKLFYWVTEAQKLFVYPPEQALYDLAMKLATTHNPDKRKETAKRKELICDYLKHKEKLGYTELKDLLKGRAIPYINSTLKQLSRRLQTSAQATLTHHPVNISADKSPHQQR